jgi:hypothetical protein
MGSTRWQGTTTEPEPERKLPGAWGVCRHPVAPETDVCMVCKSCRHVYTACARCFGIIIHRVIVDTDIRETTPATQYKHYLIQSLWPKHFAVLRRHLPCTRETCGGVVTEFQHAPDQYVDVQHLFEGKIPSKIDAGPGQTPSPAFSVAAALHASDEVVEAEPADEVSRRNREKRLERARLEAEARQAEIDRVAALAIVPAPVVPERTMLDDAPAGRRTAKKKAGWKRLHVPLQLATVPENRPSDNTLTLPPPVPPAAIPARPWAEVVRPRTPPLSEDTVPAFLQGRGVALHTTSQQIHRQVTELQASVTTEDINECLLSVLLALNDSPPCGWACAKAYAPLPCPVDLATCYRRVHWLSTRLKNRSERDHETMDGAVVTHADLHDLEQLLRYMHIAPSVANEFA